MAFALRYGHRDYPLVEGRFVIGRSETSQLCLEDPLASRNHASLVLQGGAVVLEDMGSRNGVFLNKVRVDGPQQLKHGDIVRIGSQEMTLVRRRVGRAETLAQSPVTDAMQAFGVLGGLADKALALGRGEEAERILARQLEQFLDEAERGDSMPQDVFEKCSSYAFRLAQLTRNGKWLDFLLRLYATRPALMDSELVNDLYSLSSAASKSSRKHLRAYVESLDELASTFGPSERFVLSRIEGLEKQL